MDHRTEMKGQEARDLTTESALKELREMFHGKAIFIRRDESFYPADCRDGAETIKGVTIKIGYLESDPKFRNRTLTGVMAQVRAWKESQAKEQPS